MKRVIGILLLAALPFVVLLIAYFLPVIPYVLFSISIIVVALAFGSVNEWDDSGIASHMVDILKAEAAIVVFGISLGGLVLNNFSQVVNTYLVTSILLLGSGFFVFSMIFGVLNVLIKEESSLKRWAGWAMIITLFYGLFSLLLGWSFVLKPILHSLFGT